MSLVASPSKTLIFSDAIFPRKSVGSGRTLSLPQFSISTTPQPVHVCPPYDCLGGSDLLEPPFEVFDSSTDDGAAHCSVKIVGEDTTSTKVEAPAADGQGFMCTILCDMLFCLPKEWSEKRSLKVIKALENCYDKDSYEVEEGTCYFDLRGRYAHEAKKLLISCLHGWPHPPRFVNVIVGCKVHGVGEGILKKAVTGLLKHDKNINWKKEWGGSVISIKLGGKNYPLIAEIDRSSRISILPCGGDDDDDDNNDVVDEDDSTENNLDCLTESVADLYHKRITPEKEKEWEAELEAEMTKGGWAEIEQYKGRPLCIIASDLLCCLRRPENQCWDENMSERVLAGFGKCYKRDGDKCIEGTNKVDLRGWFVEDAIEKLIQHLNLFSCLTPLGCVEVIVGCKEHGVGEGKLKQAIIGLLDSDKAIEVDKEKSDVIISIKLNGQKDYNYLKGVPREGFLSDSDDDDNSDSLCFGCKEKQEYLALNASVDDSGFTPASTMVPSFIRDFVVGQGFLLSKVKEATKVECTSRNTTMEDEERFSWTIICDLVFGLAKPSDQCDGRDSYKIIEGSNRVELCAGSADELIKLFVLHLDCWSLPPSAGCDDFIVGCNLHGFAEEKLTQAIVDVLHRHQTDFVVENRVSSIFINFDGRKDVLHRRKTDVVVENGGSSILSGRTACIQDGIKFPTSMYTGWD